MLLAPFNSPLIDTCAIGVDERTLLCPAAAIPFPVPAATVSPPEDAADANDRGGTASTGGGGGGGSDAAETGIPGLGIGGTATVGGVRRMGDTRLVAAAGCWSIPTVTTGEGGVERAAKVGRATAAAIVTRLLGEDSPMLRVLRARAAALAIAVTSARD